MDYFDNIHLTFQHSGINISGYLNGTISYWEFNSDHPIFLIYHPSGKISPRTIINYPTKIKDDFMDDFYRVADLLLMMPYKD